MAGGNSSSLILNSFLVSVLSKVLTKPLVNGFTPCVKYSAIHPNVHSVKSFVHFLVRMQKIMLTKNTELSLN